MLLPTIFRTEESLHRAWYKVARVPGNLEERLVRIGRLGDRKIHLKIPTYSISTVPQVLDEVPACTTCILYNALYGQEHPSR